MFLIKLKMPKVARGLLKLLTQAKREAWREVGEYFHANLRDKRFTNEHAKEAGYYLRKGEGAARDSKAFRRSYTGRKFSQFGHTRPLEFTGDTRRAVRQARILFTAKSVRVTYAGAKKFNFRHPKSKINMSEEFKRITRSEEKELAGVFDRRLEKVLQHLKWEMRPTS